MKNRAALKWKAFYRSFAGFSSPIRPDGNSPIRLRRIGALTALLMVCACTSVGDRTQLSVGYYSIQGEDFDEIDQQIALHGPSVSGVGRALAATSVQMNPDFEFAFVDGACRVTSARVKVKAHVTLPKLTQPDRLRRDLTQAWDNLEQYARLHEAVHVSIADDYALKAEEAIMAMPPEPSCRTLRASAIVVFRRIMAEHERDQLQFDEDEKTRISRLVARNVYGAR